MHINKNFLFIFSLFSALLITYLCYKQGLNGPFVLDDDANLDSAKLFSFDFEAIIQSVLSNTSGSLGRSFSILTFVLSSIAHGASNWGFKYHNLIIHLACGCAFALLLLKLNSETNENSKLPKILILFIILFWLIHPLNVSTVLYTVQRMTQLSFLFTVLALTSFIYAKSCQTIKRKLSFYGLAFPAFSLLAIFSKENAVLIPLYVLLINLFLSKQENFHSSHPNVDKQFLYITCFAPLIIACIYIFFNFEKYTNYDAREFNLLERLLTQINVVFSYAKQTLFPRLSEMGLYLDDIAIIKQLNYLLLIKLLLLISFLSLGLFLLFKGSIVGLGISIFFFGHSLESSFIPLELMFEHRNYLPMCGISIAVMSLLYRIPAKKIAIYSLISLYLISLTVVLNIRIGFWQSYESWSRTNIAYHPNSERTTINYLGFYAKPKNTQEAFLEEILLKTKKLPEKLSIKTLYLIESCHIENQQAKLLLQDIKKLSKKQNLTIIGYNTLLSLVEQSSKTECKNISTADIKEVVNNYAVRSSNEHSRLQGYIPLINAKIAESENNHSLAHKKYLEAFQHLKKPDMLFLSIAALINESSAESTNKAKKMIIDLTQGKYINTWVYGKSIKDFIQEIDDSKKFFRN